MSINLKSSRKRLLLLIVLCAAISTIRFIPVATTQEPSGTQRLGRVDWIFVLDTSASMRGVGGTSDIFDRVKSALETFINNTEQGDSVTVYTFDRDTVPRPTVHISDITDRRDLINILRNLEADGDRTHTGKAVRDAIERAGELKQRGVAERRTPCIVLLTDGIEDVRDIPNPVPVLSNVKRLSEVQPYLFYVSLGDEHDSLVDRLVRNPALPPGLGKVIRDRDAVDIRNIGEIIRPVLAAVLPTPSPTPLQVNINVEPISLDFGEIKRGNQTGSATLNLSSNVDVIVDLSIEGQPAGISLIEPSGPIALTANQATSVDVRLGVAADAADGQRTFLLRANVRRYMGNLPANADIRPGSSDCRLGVTHFPLWRTLLVWLTVILGVLLCVLIGVCLHMGTTPRGLLAQFERRNLLEGELEILRPRPSQPAQEFVNLAGLKSDRLMLSQVVPDGAARNAEAELDATRVKGVKLMRLRPSNGNVRVNGTVVSFAYLYDGDTIELGEARLRFNWFERQRPDDNGDAFN